MAEPGLGLAICRSLVERMGGHIGVESTPGEGSLFYFEVMAGIQKTEEVKEKTDEVEQQSFRKDINVLLAEDNATNQKLALSFLKRMGVTGKVEVANNGQEAIDFFSSGEGSQFDVILMDVQMPVKDGMTATREIKALLGDKAPIIIAMTANAFDEDKKNCFEAGMDHFVSKPVKRKTLEATFCQAFPEDTMKEENNEEVKPMTHSIFNSIDTYKILFEFEEDFDIFEELISDYKEQLPEFLQDLKTSIESKDAEKLKITAHTLKGIIGNFLL